MNVHTMIFFPFNVSKPSPPDGHKKSASEETPLRCINFCFGILEVVYIEPVALIAPKQWILTTRLLSVSDIFCS